VQVPCAFRIIQCFILSDFRILRWLRDEEERQQEQKLQKTEFLIVELSRKGIVYLFLQIIVEITTDMELLANKLI
jgi:hypothetical protein